MLSVSHFFFLNAWKKACEFVRWTTGTVLVVCFYVFFVYLNNLVLLFVTRSFVTIADSLLKLKACGSNLAVSILYFSALVLLSHTPFTCSWRFQRWTIWTNKIISCSMHSDITLLQIFFEPIDNYMMNVFFFLEWRPGCYSRLLMFGQSLNYFHRHRSLDVHHCVYCPFMNRCPV